MGDKSTGAVTAYTSTLLTALVEPELFKVKYSEAEGKTCLERGINKCVMEMYPLHFLLILCLF